MTTYTPPIRRHNNGRNHWYADAHGVRVPGVTTLIKEGVPKPALITWAGNVTADYAVDHWAELAALPPSARLAKLKAARYAERDAAANRGTAVHKLGDRLVRGDQVDVPEPLAGHVESYVRFLDDWRVQPVLVESVVVSHTHGYAGTLDLIGDIPDLRQRCLLDIKTSRSGVYGETALQLAGYRYADVYVDDTGAEVPMLAVDRCLAVHVRADGYDLLPVEAGPAQLRDFLYVIQVARWTDGSRDLIGEALTPPAGGAT